MIVCDTNVIAYLFLPSPKAPLAEQTLRTDAAWAAPLLWRSEFRNVLTLYMRQEGMSLRQAKRVMEKAEMLLAGNEFAVPSGEVLEWTAASRLSAYDAEFVVLANSLNVPFVTCDSKILREASPRAVSLENFGRKK